MNERLAAFVWSQLVHPLRVRGRMHRGETLLLLLRACDRVGLEGLPPVNLPRAERQTRFAHTLRGMGFRVEEKHPGVGLVYRPRR